jgi:glucose-6-phosphate 1-dehydrogenase
MSIERCAIVILGASGDLARRKLMPALNDLFLKGKICESCIVVGAGRTPFTNESFRSRFELSPQFSKRVFYHHFIDGLKNFIFSKGDFTRVVIFLSQPPASYGSTAGALACEGFSQETSIVIEKPFGNDLDSAIALNHELASCFSEQQIFRIDHYLAKEAVQNIMVFRFANLLFSPVWNSNYISEIQINATEDQGIFERGSYFDSAGIIRDMVQNHILQLLCLVTMEPPVSLAPDDVKARKIDILRSIKIEELHRFQYEGYRREKDVNSESTTETFAELRLCIDNFRWSGMPVFIRTGKAVNRRGTEIGIRFKKLPELLFNENGSLDNNQLIFKIQPAEGIIIDMHSKVPDTENEVKKTFLNFCYRDTFEKKSPEAYQRLLYDVLRGDHTLFVSAAETESAWSLFKGFLDRKDLEFYKQGNLPKSKLDVEWIDFNRYTQFCQ